MVRFTTSTPFELLLSLQPKLVCTNRTLLVTRLVLDDLPFRTTETRFCHSVLEELQDDVHIISKRQHLRAILATVKTERQRLKELFGRHNGALSYTVDVWSADWMRAYLGITIHWCTPDLHLHSTLLNLQPLEGQTGEHAACAFERSLRTFDLWLRVSYITTYGGFDMLRMVRLLAARIPGFDPTQQGLRCLYHGLNIAIKDIFARLQCEGFQDEKVTTSALGVVPTEADGAPPADYLHWHGEGELALDHDILDFDRNQSELHDLETLLRKARTLVVAIRRFGKRRRSLEAYFAPFPNLRPCHPELDIHGRWNSIHTMFERLIYFKKPLEYLCSEDRKLLQYWPTLREWNLISKFTKILEGHKEAIQTSQPYKPVQN
jgi:hypothetical protein